MTKLIKSISIFGFTMFLFFGLVAFLPKNDSIHLDNLDGAWETTRLVDGKPVKHRVLISGSYFTFTEYAADGGAFSYTMGGSWKEEFHKMKITYEFHTMDSTKVGESEQWTASLKDGQLNLMTYKNSGEYELIDDPKESKLMGTYLFSGRKRNGEIQMRDTDRPRKTMKMLTGSHFQWIAYNTETKKFFGTGGGSYSAEDGKYVENIQFFSRDDSRVGASLNFDFDIKDGAWHHSGFSSKGDPMYEIWAKRVK